NQSVMKEEAVYIRVLVATNTMIFEGNLFLSKLGKEERRLSNLLNSDKKFIALTDVLMTSRQAPHVAPENSPFVEVSLRSIEYLKPL
ncbi:MAG: hypothetical protein K2X66_09555, partial [Cyanobacteria bacterium]|nr:hypothetical protein [Cyanobacteriota bacterium]